MYDILINYIIIILLRNFVSNSVGKIITLCYHCCYSSFFLNHIFIGSFSIRINRLNLVYYRSIIQYPLNWRFRSYVACENIKLQISEYALISLNLQSPGNDPFIHIIFYQNTRVLALLYIFLITDLIILEDVRQEKQRWNTFYFIKIIRNPDWNFNSTSKTKHARYISVKKISTIYLTEDLRLLHVTYVYICINEDFLFMFEAVIEW